MIGQKLYQPKTLNQIITHTVPKSLIFECDTSPALRNYSSTGHAMYDNIRDDIPTPDVHGSVCSPASDPLSAPYSQTPVLDL